MPVRKSHPYAKGCDEPAEITEIRAASTIFQGMGFAEQMAMQTYLLYLIAQATGAFDP